MGVYFNDFFTTIYKHIKNNFSFFKINLYKLEIKI